MCVELLGNLTFLTFSACIPANATAHGMNGGERMGQKQGLEAELNSAGLAKS